MLSRVVRLRFSFKKSLNSDITCYLLWSRITQCSKFLENQHFGCTIVLLYLSLTFILCFLYSYFGIYFCFVVFSGWGLYCIRSPYFVTTILWQIHYKAYAKKMRGLTFTLGKCFLHSVLLLILELMGFFCKILMYIWIYQTRFYCHIFVKQPFYLNFSQKRQTLNKFYPLFHLKIEVNRRQVLLNHMYKYLHGRQTDLKSGGAERNFETYFVKLFSKIENK